MAPPGWSARVVAGRSTTPRRMETSLRRGPTPSRCNRLRLLEVVPWNAVRRANWSTLWMLLPETARAQSETMGDRMCGDQSSLSTRRFHPWDRVHNSFWLGALASLAFRKDCDTPRQELAKVASSSSERAYTAEYESDLIPRAPPGASSRVDSPNTRARRRRVDGGCGTQCPLGCDCCRARCGGHRLDHHLVGTVPVNVSPLPRIAPGGRPFPGRACS